MSGSGLSPIRNKIAIVGTGFSKVSKHAAVPLGSLAVTSCLRALADAGITTDDVDGCSTYPNPSRLGAGATDGVDFVGVEYIARALRLTGLQWICSVGRGTVTTSLVEAIHAVASGASNYALVWRAMYNPPGRFGRLRQDEVGGDAEYVAPYGFGHNVIAYALPYSRYMSKYGATRDHMATFIVRNRANAARNPDAIFFGQAIDRDDYMNSRMIAEPLSLLDCDMPVSGSGAVVVTTADRARDLSNAPAFVTGYSCLGLSPRRSLFLTLEDYEHAVGQVATNLWRSTGMGPSDMTHIHLYDGFSWFPYVSLEGLGFCNRGEAFEFVQSSDLDLDGRLPMTTSGGALGMGRLHGIPQLIEAVRQVQNSCGDRQITNADRALVQVGSGPRGSSMLVLSRYPD